MADLWYCKTTTNKETGPFTLSHLQRLLAGGRIGPDTLIRKSTSQHSLTAAEIPELQLDGDEPKSEIKEKDHVVAAPALPAINDKVCQPTESVFPPLPAPPIRESHSSEKRTRNDSTHQTVNPLLLVGASVGWTLIAVAFLAAGAIAVFKQSTVRPLSQTSAVQYASESIPTNVLSPSLADVNSDPDPISTSSDQSAPESVFLPTSEKPDPHPDTSTLPIPETPSEVGTIEEGHVMFTQKEQSASYEITVIDDNQQHVTIQARWIAESKEAVALERRDGRWEVVPAERIVERTPREIPPALTPEEIEHRLQREFESKRTVSMIDPPHVLLYIATKSVVPDKKTSMRWKHELQRVNKELKEANSAFLDFAHEANLEVTKVRYPLVVLIFEGNKDFDFYYTAQTDNKGLPAIKIGSFYDLLSNRLVFRLQDCGTIARLRHVSVHQQAHNTGILNRLAPVPVWFTQGLATAFEGDGPKITNGRPNDFNRSNAARALKATQMSWSEIVADDTIFMSDTENGGAHAWGLHWWLVTRYRAEYLRLIGHYSNLQPLIKVPSEQKLKEFESFVGRSPDELQREFSTEATSLLRK